MKIRKREYFLRGGKDFTLTTDEELYSAKVDISRVYSDWWSFYSGRVNVYKKAGIGEPNAYQRYWMFQRFKEGSVITLGPVGIGKTTFALIEALSCKEKVVIIVPTRALANNIYQRLLQLMEMVGVEKTVVLYEKKVRDDVVKGNFHIAILTSQAFRVIYDDISWHSSLSIVDDVDAFTKNPKNLDRLLNITDGGIILSSATFKASPTQRKKLIEKFHISIKRSRFVGFRNIEDVYKDVDSTDELKGQLISFIRQMGPGGVVFLPQGAREDEWLSFLRDNGINAAIGSEESLSLLAEGKVDVLVGKAVFYGVLVRGIDMPTAMRYTVFVGVPRGQIVLKRESDISRWWKTFIGGSVPHQWDMVISKINEVSEQKGWVVNASENEIRIWYPDITTYIQASGRTSRFVGHTFTFGVSLVLEENRHLLLTFLRKASLYGITFSVLDDVDVSMLRKQVDESRKKTIDTSQPIFRSHLLLVESPHKVDTIASLLGGGTIRYVQTGLFTVKLAEVSFGTSLLVIGATTGHTSDIVEVAPRQWPYPHRYGVSVEEDGFFPIMDTIKMKDNTTAVVVDGEEGYRDKLDLIKLYRTLAAVVDDVLVATDPDSEGERIAYEVGAYLHIVAGRVGRVRFREITRRALSHALESVDTINTGRVEAALTRRIEDRWVGFYLSEKLSGYMGRKGLSGGRVQSPVLGWIIERYDRSKSKKTVYRVVFPFIDGFYYETEEMPPEEVSISRVEIYNEQKHPLPPYSTDTMLSDASRMLGFTASYTMKLAQDLFEGGFITYHRTDSTRVSDDGKHVAKIYISQHYGEEMYQGRSWDISLQAYAQDAHECIRPTRPIDVYEFWDVAGDMTRDHGRLYALIFRRFMASQSVDAVLKMLSFVADGIGEITVFIDVIREGYLVFFRDVKVYPLTVNDIPRIVKIDVSAIERPVAYPMKEEDVIKAMKEQGIGRPSTYGKILDIIKRRKYVYVTPKGFLIPTKLGRAVWEYLRQHYPHFVSTERTRALYEKMDAIEDGKVDYMDVLREVYREIH